MSESEVYLTSLVMRPTATLRLGEITGHVLNVDGGMTAN
jgi:hypothetical protein